MTIDSLQKDYIQGALTGAAKCYTVQTFESVTSTNLLLKEMAQKGAPHGTVLIAEEQSAGRGRLGKRFFSPHATGVYLSVLVRSRISVQKALCLTTGSAVASAQAFEVITGNPMMIKWVNDVYYNDRKVAGILTESAVLSGGETLDWAVIGIGVNCMIPKDGFPEEIAARAGALFAEERPCRNELAAAMINNIAQTVEQIEKSPRGNEHFIEEYRRRSYLTGKEITVLANPPYPARCVGIDDDGALLVLRGNGECERLSAGDVSVLPHQERAGRGEN